MIYTINNCIRAFGYTNFDNLIADMGSVDNLREYVRANGYADIAVAEDTELLLVDVNGKTWHTGCYGAVIEPPKPYLCFTSTGDSTIRIRQVGTPNKSANKVIQYKLNDGQWQTWDLSAVSLADGDKMYLKSDDDISMSEDYNADIYKLFIMTGSIAASGNIMSLLNFSDTLPVHAFMRLFMNCTSLTTTPELPATTLSRDCYRQMFQDCTSLTTAPELPATTLADSCYKLMFYNCSNLNYVKAMFTSASSFTYSLNLWLENVSPTGTFVKNSAATWTNADAQIPSGWTVQVEGGVTPGPEPERDYLCFTSTGDSTVAITQKGTPEASANKVIQYKLNNGQWQTWDLLAVSLADGDKMYLKSDDEIPVSENYNIYKKFVMTGSIAASGNIMSLLNFSDTLQAYAFNKLFSNCTSLTTAPELLAITLDQYCYNHMFSNCTSLTTAPELPATALAQDCYFGMFERCSSLTTAPALPATTLTNNCYNIMFQGCTSLTTAPELPATALATGCYNAMFSGCSKLNNIKAMFTDISAQNCLTNWLNSVSTTGTFIKSKDATWTNEQAGIPTGWTVQVEGGVTPGPEPERDYLCYTISCPDSSTFKNLINTSLTTTKKLYYKINDGEWLRLYEGNIYNINNNDKLYLKSDDNVPMCASNGSRYIVFGNEITRVDISGNIMSLMNFSDTLPEYCFRGLFIDTQHLTDASKLILPNIVSNNCYEQMFYNCKSLTTAPELPATTLADNCYRSMFQACTSLTQAPALPATTLADSCYKQMFKGCTSLTATPALPVTTLATYCYYEMFDACTSLVNAPALPATTMVNRCYYSMFSGCTSLTTAPELPATTLAEYCYCKMFNGCINLNYVKAMFTDSPGPYLMMWLDNVSSTGTFVKNAAATWTNDEVNIPTGWTVQTASPDK